MPYRVDKKSNGYKLYNTQKKKYAKPTFKSRSTASRAGKNYSKYDKRKKK